jgi:hypothetical protein
MTTPYLVYIGKGKGTLPGVPARDLTYSEAQQHNEARLLGSGLYTLQTEPKHDAEIIMDLLIDETPKKRRSKKESE